MNKTNQDFKPLILQPMKAYKYISEDYIDGFIKNGIVKVGTIAEYRAIEHDEIGDNKEGTEHIITRTKDFNASNLNADNISSLPYGVQGLLNIRGSGTVGTFIVQDVTRGTINTYPDAYVYCVTLTPTKEAMLAFATRENERMYCVEISDINEFGRIIGQKLFDSSIILDEYYCDNCKYIGREFIDDSYQGQANNYPNAYFFKEEKLSHQAEYRVVYIPKPPVSELLSYKIIACPDLIELCTLYEFPDSSTIINQQAKA